MVGLGSLARKFFGSSNDRRVKGYRPQVQEIFREPAAPALPINERYIDVHVVRLAHPNELSAIV